MRRLANGMPCMLLATFLLFARLVAPAMAVPMPPADGITQLAICHTAAPGEQPGGTGQPDHHDCLLCPACHLASHAVLPLSAAPGLPLPQGAFFNVATPPPPATGPPLCRRAAAQPTGPPAFSA